MNGNLCAVPSAGLGTHWGAGIGVEYRPRLPPVPWSVQGCPAGGYLNEQESSSLGVVIFWRIASLPSSSYVLLKPIQVALEVASDDEVIAHFSEGEMAMSGDNLQDALEGLTALVLDCLDDWKDAASDTLGPIPARQLAVLREYVQWT